MRISDWSSDVCSSDLAKGNCTGCARTTREIACWGALDEADRLEIMRELPERIAAMGDKAAEPEEALALINAVLQRSDDALKRRAKARSEEHTSELQSLMRISYAVFCLTKKKTASQKV